MNEAHSFWNMDDAKWLWYCANCPYDKGTNGRFILHLAPLVLKYDNNVEYRRQDKDSVKWECLRFLGPKDFILIVWNKEIVKPSWWESWFDCNDWLTIDEMLLSGFGFAWSSCLSYVTLHLCLVFAIFYGPRVFLLVAFTITPYILLDLCLLLLGFWALEWEFYILLSNPLCCASLLVKAFIKGGLKDQVEKCLGVSSRVMNEWLTQELIARFEAILVEFRCPTYLIMLINLQRCHVSCWVYCEHVSCVWICRCWVCQGSWQAM